jgi:TfoX/Sxy family transcriptional regulator of competence genes
VRAALQSISGVSEKKMFGSHAFLVGGKMAVSARAERIMCRIDPAGHDAATKRPGCTTVVMGGRRYRGYVYVAVDAVKTEPALSYWIGLALSFNAASKRPSSRRKAAPTKRSEG